MRRARASSDADPIEAGCSAHARLERRRLSGPTRCCSRPSTVVRRTTSLTRVAGAASAPDVAAGFDRQPHAHGRAQLRSQRARRQSPRRVARGPIARSAVVTVQRPRRRRRQPQHVGAPRSPPWRSRLDRVRRSRLRAATVSAYGAMRRGVIETPPCTGRADELRIGLAVSATAASPGSPAQAAPALRRTLARAVRARSGR